VQASSTLFTITNVFPGSAENDVLTDTFITASFSAGVDAGTVNTRTFTVRGRQAGTYGGSFVVTDVLPQLK